MGDVIQLRKTTPKSDAKASMPIETDQWECFRCKADQFTLWAKGKITCAECNAEMSNLEVKVRL